jgi:hypothetical protein
MPDFSDFDTRHYRTVDVATGYDGWSSTYEDSVLDAMDLALLDGLTAPDWSRARRAADLGCGTGRPRAWGPGRGGGAGWGGGGGAVAAPTCLTLL